MLGIHKHGPLLGGSHTERAIKRAATAKHGAELEAADVLAPAGDLSDGAHARVTANAAASIAQRYPMQRQAQISTLGPAGVCCSCGASVLLMGLLPETLNASQRQVWLPLQ